MPGNETETDLRKALDLLLLMCNEDGAGDLDWDKPALKGTTGWEIRQLVTKYKLAGTPAAPSCDGSGLFLGRLSTMSGLPCLCCVGGGGKMSYDVVTALE